MFSLFLDTHDSEIALCLYKDGKAIDNIIKSSNRNHSDYTMPLLNDLLNNNSLRINDIQEIIVVNGPGSFTGVRLGVTIAKTLAYTLNIPIKTITSLEMYAVSSDMKSNKLSTINDVKGVFGAYYTEDNSLIGEMFYMNNKEYEEYLEKNNLKEYLIVEKTIDFNKIYSYVQKLPNEVAHNVNPIYIKVIEALKND